MTGDGKLDIVIADKADYGVSVLLSNGNGTFQAARNFPTYGTFTGPNYLLRVYPMSVALGDLTGDGKLDIVVADEQRSAVAVLLGNGNGTFQADQTFAGGGSGMALADMTGDGKLDIVTSSVSVLLANGNGTFQAQQTFYAASVQGPIALGDVNGDGKPDLAVDDGDAVNVLFGGSNGNFTGQVYYVNIATATPFVQSIDRTTPVGTTTNASSVSFTVTFSEAVTGVNASDFQLGLGGSVAASLTAVTPVNGSVYTVTVSGITGTGTLGLNLVDNESICDLAGNRLTQQDATVALQTPQTYDTGSGPAR